ncbi:GIY-YIG nuclease family protein [Streptomyces sp. NPDC059556]|uniref:GIY-YIG nuclease family protein n=1 Tax=Streptomyces sp. NPDC059556 TaxID=3346863 RepID=UPI0036BABFD0
MGARPTAVYRLFDLEETLLYVGISVSPDRRFEEHAKNKPWWNEVDRSRTVITWYRDRFAAAVVEQQDERAGTPRYGKDQPAFGRLFLAKLAAEGYDTTPIPPPSI